MGGGTLHRRSKIGTKIRSGKSRERSAKKRTRAVVVAQLAEQSFQITEVHGSNPDTGIFIYCQLHCIEKTKIKEKRPISFKKREPEVVWYIA